MKLCGKMPPPLHPLSNPTSSKIIDLLLDIFCHLYFKKNTKVFLSIGKKKNTKFREGADNSSIELLQSPILTASPEGLDL